MKIHDGLNAQGHLTYFEVSNALLTRRAACDVVSRVPGVTISSRAALWPFGDDVFCKFELDGIDFELWEPYGDSSRFHVAAQPLRPCEALQRLRSAFAEHQPASGALRWLLLLIAAMIAFISVWPLWH